MLHSNDVRTSTASRWVRLGGAALFASALALSGGCKQYYTIDEACTDNLSSDNNIPAVSREALKRVNCYRRMTGVLKVPADDQVQIAADGTIRYMQQNPDWKQLTGEFGPVFWLTQSFEAPGFSGTNVYERLTADPTRGGAGYVFTDLGGTSIWEFIWVVLANDPTELPSGADAVDELMRFPVFRQSALQPSWVDGAYAEGELKQDWFVDGGYFPDGAEVNPALAPYGRVYYMVVLYKAPHFEHAATPVLMPRTDELDVPLYSWSQNRNIVQDDGTFAPTQLSYPVTLLMGTIDEAAYNPVDQNQYDTLMRSASIVGPEGPLETEVVHPGDEAEDSWPHGAFLRTTLAIYARHPFEPSTWYTVYGEYTTPNGEFALEYRFHTRAEDPGVDPVVGATGPTAATPIARSTGSQAPASGTPSLPVIQPGSIDHPRGTLGPVRTGGPVLRP